MKATILKFFKLLLIIFAIFLLIFLANKNFPKSGQINFEMKLGKDLPTITKLGPEPRAVLKDGFQSILESPVYFDIRSMPWFKKATITLTFEENGLILEGIGGQADLGWQYDIKKPITVNDLENGQRIAVFSFDLNEIYQKKNIRRFLISLKPSEGQDAKELKIYSLKIVLSQ